MISGGCGQLEYIESEYYLGLDANGEVFITIIAESAAVQIKMHKSLSMCTWYHILFFMVKIPSANSVTADPYVCFGYFNLTTKLPYGFENFGPMTDVDP